MSVESVKLTNFQCHKKLVLSFSDGLNVIVGPSDVGKSAILRAICWALTNKPSGDLFFNREAKGKRGSKVSSKLVVDGQIVERAKGTENLYYLNGKKFRSFGSDVPEEVGEFLNIGEINIQRQLDPPFLLSESPGSVGRKLNKIVDLEKIDRSLKNINRVYREETSRLGYKKEELEKVESELTGFDWLEAATSCLNQVAVMMEEIFSLSARIEALDRLVEEIEALEERVLHLSSFVEVDEEELSEIEALVEDSSVLEGKIRSLSDLMGSVEEVERKAQELREAIRIEEKEFSRLMPKVCPLCGGEVK